MQSWTADVLSHRAISSCNPPRAWRHRADAIRRNSEAIFLTSGFVYDSAEQAEATFTDAVALPVLAVRQPDRRHAGAAPGRHRRGRGLPRHGDRHGGRPCRHAVPPQDRRPRGGVARAVRLVPLDRLHAAAALRHRRPSSSTAATSTRGATRCRTPAQMVLLESPSNPMLDVVDLRAVASWPTRRARWSWSTTCSRRRCCRRRSSWARTSWCIPAPSTSTARAACWAAPCWAARLGSRARCSRSSATPAPACPRSTPGCC